MQYELERFLSKRLYCTVYSIKEEFAQLLNMSTALTGSQNQHIIGATNGTRNSKCAHIRGQLRNWLAKPIIDINPIVSDLPPTCQTKS